MRAPDRSGQSRVDVVLVTAPRCHFCNDAAELLEDLRARYRIAIREVALQSDEGADIAARFRVPFPPVLLIEGDYFGHGRISRRKLTKALDAMIEPDLPR
ncbi:MAG: glutaredoxin [Actinomycetia bacterium]|nr:glutaredoxin [Actinomycetes bacterium]